MKFILFSVAFSGSSGLYIAFFVEGGFISSIGFEILALLWLYTTIMAYLYIKNKNIEKHQQWMVRSYALCFAAVTLRIYLPIFLGVLERILF